MTDSPLLAECPPGLPRHAYVSDDWFAREQVAIWLREWIYVGRHDSFPAGSLRRVTLGAMTLLISRDATGELRAFHNLCRHRGAELCTSDEAVPAGKLIRCPYHAWAYDRNGALVSTGPATPTADFDPAAHGLLTVHLRDWNGFVFINLAPSPPDFVPDIGLDALDRWPMKDLVVGHRQQVELACNWKVFWENYNECLHCPGVHASLSERVPAYARGIMSPAEAPPDHPVTGPTLRDGAQSWTVSGRLCGPAFPDLTEADRAEGHRFVTMYPGIYIVAHADYARCVSLRPLSPERTELTAEWLFHPDTMAALGFDLADVIGFATTVIAEDGAACELNQRGLRSPAFPGATLMPQEFEILALHNWILKRMNAANDT